MPMFNKHKYTWTQTPYASHHQWSFLGPKGGISFAFSTHGEGDPLENTTAGLEFHHYYDPSGGKEAPHHAPCWLLGAPCWHDGTSLYASEHVLPVVLQLMPDHKSIFNYLEGEYRKHFNVPEITLDDGLPF